MTKGAGAVGSQVSANAYVGLSVALRVVNSGHENPEKAINSTDLDASRII